MVTKSVRFDDAGCALPRVNDVREERRVAIVSGVVRGDKCETHVIVLGASPIASPVHHLVPIGLQSKESHDGCTDLSSCIRSWITKERARRSSVGPPKQ